METASLENERLRTQSKECQDALEAQTSQVQAKDCRITQLQATVLVTKSDVSRIMAKHKSVRNGSALQPKMMMMSKMKMWSEHLEFCYAPALLRASRIYVRDIKQANRRQIRAWIRAAAQDDDEEEQDEDVE